ncbi:DNA topoisomerase IB [Rhabdobacter roseus]|uniref:DNA topoisomerase n=1 Tax=Rhabdobacter roseus TaxID=1655419 RepID=A0A840TSF9_9BACT|nr:DNA topoisomerase IB [Rhabdobacter roseus]MBB5284203.1 DNA topoisomerase-1 [Rhabdobacter roseus]
MSIVPPTGTTPDFRALPVKGIKKLSSNPVLTAAAAGLNYLRSGNAPGLRRRKAGKGFYYLDEKGQRCTDPETLKRIKALALPPAWREVWISQDPLSHLQATGLDEADRKQYRYHAHWNQIRNHTKYYRLLSFANALPQLRAQVEKDLRQRHPTLSKAVALVVKLMEKTCIRVGNLRYKVKHGSSGITTLDARQADVQGNKLRFLFVGKKGIKHDITLRDRTLARLVKAYKDMPGRRLFQYLNDDGKRCTISARHVNEYIQTHTGGNFSAKDFRTWMGTVTAFEYLSTQAVCQTQREFNRKINACLDAVALHLGNTRAVCRKYYVHPAVVHAFEQDKLAHFVSRSTQEDSPLSPTEQRVKALLSSFKLPLEQAS